MDGDAADVRLFSDAAVAGVKRAIAAGAKTPLIYCAAPLELTATAPGFEEAPLVTILGALYAAYVPIAIRETRQRRKIEKLGFFRGDGVPGEREGRGGWGWGKKVDRRRAGIRISLKNVQSE